MTRTNEKPTAVPGPKVPELEHARSAVLNSLDSIQSRRSYEYAMAEFIGWYCSAAPRAGSRIPCFRR